MDYRTMFDPGEYLGAWDLKGRDVDVTIVKVEARTLKNKQGSNRKPVIFVKGSDRGVVINKTNGKTIAAIYGKDTTKWVGKRITLYATTTSAGGETVDCIRVRPEPPKAKSSEQEPEQPAEQPAREAGSEG